MIGDEAIQAGIISRIKALAPYGSSFGSVQSGEVREWDWQGDAFTYPNIRVELEDNIPYFDEQLRCSLQRTEFSVYIYSEQRSSKECSQIKTNLNNSLLGEGFTINGIKYSDPRLVESVPAIRETERVWRSQLRYSTKVTNSI